MKIATVLFRPHLDPGEKILAVCHRHPFVMVADLGKIVLFGFVIPCAIWYIFPEGVLFYVLWIAIHIARAFYVISNWYHDALLLTNVSLLRVGWFGFFDRTSSRLEYQMIEGLNYAIRGFIKTIFHYGDVAIVRSGGNTAFSLPDAINPAKVERLVLKYQENFVADQNLKDADTLKNLLTVMLRHHAKTQGVPKK